MRIGILGTGGMARALGGGWVRAGHEVVIGGRSPDKAAALAAEIGAGGGTLADAVQGAEVVLLAVQHTGIADTLAAVKADEGALAGRVLIDCTNAVETVGYTLELPAGHSSLAEYVAQETGAFVAKAFNTAQDLVWSAPTGATVLCCGASESESIVTALVDDLGHIPVWTGGLDRARYVEAVGATTIWLLGHGQPSGSVLNWVPAHDDEATK